MSMTMESKIWTTADVKQAIINGEPIAADAIEAAGLLPTDVDEGRRLHEQRQAAAKRLQRATAEAAAARAAEDEAERPVDNMRLEPGITIGKLRALLARAENPHHVSQEKAVAYRKRLDSERAAAEADAYLRRTADQSAIDAAGRASNAYKYAADELDGLRGKDPTRTGEARFGNLAWTSRQARKRIEEIEDVLERAGNNPDVLYEQRRPNVAESARDIAVRLRGELTGLRRDAKDVAQRIAELEANLPALQRVAEQCEFAYRQPECFRFPV